MSTVAPIPRLLRLPVVLDRVGLRRSRIYELMDENRFPRPVRLGERAVAWVEEEVLSWTLERIAERDSEAT